jgi:hypothetical protein
METEALLPRSQVPANCPCPEPARSSPYFVSRYQSSSEASVHDSQRSHEVTKRNKSLQMSHDCLHSAAVLLRRSGFVGRHQRFGECAASTFD